MPLNLPTYTENDFSFGPGILFLGADGATPTVDVGAITEDGITISPENEKKTIFAGNPKLPIYTFNQAQNVRVSLTGIEWDFDSLAYALGAGNTTSSGAEDTWALGGDALTKRVAIHVQHAMAVTGNTMNAYIWRAVSDGNPELPLTHDEHQFAMQYMAQRIATDWAGNTLVAAEQLAKVVRVK